MIKGAIKLMTKGQDVKLDGKSESVLSEKEPIWQMDENFNDTFRQYSVSIVQF